MTEQPTTPEQPVRPMPRLGHGVHWPAIVAEIDRAEQTRRRAAEPEPTPSVSEAGSSLGAAMHTCADHCQCDEARCSSCADCGHVCENHPDRPWAGVSDDINACDCDGAGMPCPVCCDPIPEDGSTSIGAAFIPRKFAAGGLVRLPSDPADDVVPFPVTRCLYEQPRAEAPAVDVTKPGFGIVSIAEARSWGIAPPPAVELLAMADDLNAHGGLDERFVAGLLLAAMPPHLIGDRVPDPMHHEQPIRAVPDLLERLWWRRTLDRVRRWTR